MANPRLLLCDTDALIQVFLTKDQTKKLLPLRILKDAYGIQPAIVVEVETELRSTRRYLNQFDADLKKATGNGTLLLLDEGAFGNYVSPSNLSRTIYSSFQNLGKQHYRYAHRGEAYTFAAAVTLGEPALSNDASALEALDRQGFPLPSPVLRVFDLLAFCLQTGDLTEKDCDSTRRELIRLEEPVPRIFQRASFGDGLPNFCPRFLDGKKACIGQAPSPCAAYKMQRLLDRL